MNSVKKSHIDQKCDGQNMWCVSTFQINPSSIDYYITITHNLLTYIDLHR